MKRISWLVVIALLGGCDIPQDPNGTLTRAKGGMIRVGISENPPWTSLVGGSPGGIEAGIVEELARDLGARIVWVPGPEAELIRSLHRFDLDMVIAGLTEDRPWKKQVAFTRPYLRTSGRIGAPPGMTPPVDVAGLEVLVRQGSVLTDSVRRKGAHPVPVHSLPGSHELVAAEDWELSRWNYHPAAEELVQRKHVVALPPGENGWLVYLERFLHTREETIKESLHQRR